jgi:hypothetical protein
MPRVLQKQMLYLSTQNQDKDPVLIFEIEPYYEKINRQIHTERQLETFDIQALLDDDVFMDDVGRKLVLGLLVSGNLKDSKGRLWAQIVYPHERHGIPVLRIDEEPYEYKPHRRFCASLPLPTLNMSEAVRNEALKIKIATMVLEHLPQQANAP